MIVVKKTGRVLVPLVLLLLMVPLHGEGNSEQRDIVAQAQQISNPEAPFKIQLWTEEKKDTYNAGDSVTFVFVTDRDCFVTLIDIGTSGKVTKIFPNEFQADNKVKAGVENRIPAQGGTFRFRVDPPAGLEFVKAIATLDPLTSVTKAAVTKSGAFDTFQKPAEAIKDIGVELAAQDKQRWAETNLSFKIAAAPAAQPFSIKLTTDKKTYAIGESIVFNFQADQPCRLTLIDIGSSGQVRIIFPNQYQTNDQIQTTQPYKIPPDGIDPKFSYKVVGPPGINTIKAIATLDPCQLYPAVSFKEKVYPELGPKEKVMKDIQVGLATLQPGRHAEADCTIEIR
jgi:hypothetical protein